MMLCCNGRSAGNCVHSDLKEPTAASIICFEVYF